MVRQNSGKVLMLSGRKNKYRPRRLFLKELQPGKGGYTYEIISAYAVQSSLQRTQKPKPKVINNIPAKTLISPGVSVAFASVVDVSVPDLCLTVIVSLSLLPP